MWTVIAALVALGPGAHRSAVQPAPQAPAPALLSPEQLRKTVETYLGSIDTPIPAARWQALGPAAGPVLEQVLDDPKAFPSRRAKALDGLVWAAPERAAPRVTRLAQSEDEPIVVRVAALHGAVLLQPARQLVATLRPVLESAREPGMRAAAAELLARHGRSAGCQAVRAQAGREATGAFDRALARCE